MHRLQICRELGIDCPAILLDVNDVRAREIALEENLGRRTMTQKQKKIIAYQLRNIMNLRYTQIAERLCLSHVTVGNWLRAANTGNENEQKLYKFLKKCLATVTRIIYSIKESEDEYSLLRKHQREEVNIVMSDLLDEVLTLSEELKRINSSQKWTKVTKETCRPDFVEDSSIGQSKNQVHCG